MAESELTGAGDSEYDGIPYEDLEFSEIEWHDPAHIEHRSTRKRSAEIDLDRRWANEAVADPQRLVGSAGSRSGISVVVLGYSPSAGRLLHVVLVPANRPPKGLWRGASAWPAPRNERRQYERRHQ